MKKGNWLNQTTIEELAHAVIRTECHFLTISKIIFEVFAWALFTFFKMDRVNTLSIGLSQVKLKIWVDAGVFDNVHFSVKKCINAHIYSYSYRVCLFYLKNNAKNRLGSIDDFVDCYCGTRYPYYISLLYNNLQDEKANLKRPITLSFN